MRVLTYAVVLVGLTFLGGCGSSGGSGSGATSLATLPKVTGAVGTGTAIHSAGDLQALATTGFKLADWNTINWNGKSRAFCHVGSAIRHLFSEASRADLIMCYMGVMQANNRIPNPYTGTYQYYTVSDAGGGGGSNPGLKIKFKVVKTGDVITSFEMFECEGNTNSNNGYLSQTINGTTAAMESVGSHTGQEGSGKHRASVTGTYAAGTWTEKIIQGFGMFFGSFQGNNFSHKAGMTLTQLAQEFRLRAKMYDSFGNQSHEAAVFSAVQLLNASKLPTIALGTGAAKAQFDGGTLNTARWNGDTGKPGADQTDFDSQLAEGQVGDATQADITTKVEKTAAETWDCKAEGDFQTASASGLENQFKACDDQFRFTHDGGFSNCEQGQ